MESPEKERKRTTEEIQDAQIGLLDWELEIHGTDHLTGVKTRKAFIDEIDRAVRAMQLHGQEKRTGHEPFRELSVIFLDLDNFKHVNDEYGHSEGDKVLMVAAESISASVREGQDVVGRFGGDEFCVFLPHTNKDQTLVVAKKIINNIRSNELLAKYGVTASIGSYHVTNGNPSDLNSEYIIKRADDAETRAKQKGKNTIVIDGVD